MGGLQALDPRDLDSYTNDTALPIKSGVQLPTLERRSYSSPAPDASAQPQLNGYYVPEASTSRAVQQGTLPAASDLPLNREICSFIPALCR